MALSNGCAHHFVLIKSESSLIQWTCQLCQSGPHYFIYECRYCKMRTCRPCIPGYGITAAPRGGGCVLEKECAIFGNTVIQLAEDGEPRISAVLDVAPPAVSHSVMLLAGKNS
ncbi:hypothetical protein GE21DRAFT_6500 [Neurospora crassa]|uniref:Uncharacterized protein n=1 Tax=Neurospora crassa (strain ATCC 24698 / 74-OR23-1A / CBS 708.71 / DSM 1257 / FGSC 987) TaxID=367110 RepID=Q7S832_NEUCR|nr:hypothetical protein NCU07009 [Neurospora crassa OR74A]EAA32494.2 hypothetical protein NCU07009 [Neurospora crassa OR74A]KHE78481.1 hypothetical protein GE21DRAFT_6500 [Neurospora crassa]|eukprot:XP_961730.2 hypothetical protein NCU07009 [Neurospora crassa OR74A]